MRDARPFVLFSWCEGSSNSRKFDKRFPWVCIATLSEYASAWHITWKMNDMNCRRFIHRQPEAMFMLFLESNIEGLLFLDCYDCFSCLVDRAFGFSRQLSRVNYSFLLLFGSWLELQCIPTETRYFFCWNALFATHGSVLEYRSAVRAWSNFVHVMADI